ncbi:MAG: hypothetical protein B0D91_14885 [Oceanospirillales bacterium LUC14_002_19_P2]|nr:MAG: hypothetical protein B0D91_14885 [Oceanospirillales bacterium LUC14_002_19_P2]
MKLLNRSAVSLKPTALFVEWANRVNPDEAMALEAFRAEGSIYLFDEVEQEEDFEQWLSLQAVQLFENELAAWEEDEGLWPSVRDYSLFVQWFDVEPQLVCFDVSDQPLMRADLEAL